ncbi:hypothetical protein GCM10022223_22420 [Kineosporia mesophila]|uniref:MFS transporter n=1 Tax=Kineosporia mesophila TaxID=566012 RepID=A0ABP6ZFI6_9ACTN
MATIGGGGNEFTPLVVMYRAHGYSTVGVDTLPVAYVAGLVPGLLVASALSDRHGRRPVTIVGGSPRWWVACLSRWGRGVPDGSRRGGWTGAYYALAYVRFTRPLILAGLARWFGYPRMRLAVCGLAALRTARITLAWARHLPEPRVGKSFRRVPVLNTA